jgi:predicted transcriptional regulator of viral defense system
LKQEKQKYGFTILFYFQKTLFLQQNRTEMNFIDFKSKMQEFVCFNLNQIYAFQPDFDRNNLFRWKKKGYLIALRNGCYTFTDFLGKPGYAYFFANKMYQPSYVSLHSALAFYGIIPEAVVQIISVSSLKTAFFRNPFGEFSYKKLKSELMFGYDLKPLNKRQNLFFATPEKSILDLLYLYPFYNNEQEICELRFDETFMQNDLNVERLNEFTEKFKSKALRKRVNLLLKIYGI